MAACLSPFIDRNRIGGRLPLTRVFHNACAWNRDVRRTCVQPHVSTYACALARYNRVHRLEAQIQRAELVHRTVQRRRKIVLILRLYRETRDAQREVCMTRAWLLASSEYPPSASARRVTAREIKLSQPIMCQRDAKAFFNIFQITIAILWFCILHYVCWIEISIDIKFFSTSL